MNNNNSNTAPTSTAQNETNSNNIESQVTISMWDNNNGNNNNNNNNITNNNVNTININNNNNILENDDFDSDQLDEDESYSWASGITDNQDGMGSNGHAGNTLIGCTGSSGATGGCSSSTANWRDWRSTNMPNDLLMNMGVMNRITTNNFTINNSFSTPNLIRNWQVTNQRQPTTSNVSSPATIPSLTDLCARYVAANLPFELVESFKQPVPEDLQLKVTYSSFPDNIENIRLYSCLDNGCVDEYIRGEQLYHNKCIRKIMQIGFHLSAQVVISSPLGINGTANTNSSNNNNSSSNNNNNNNNNATSSLFLQNNYKNLNNMTMAGLGNGASSLFASVAIVCDRKRIISCHCTCSKQSIPWCSHIVAVCLFRILEADSVEYRAPVSESVNYHSK